MYFFYKNHLKVSEFKDQKLIFLKMSCYKKDLISKTKSNYIVFFKIPIMKFLVLTNFVQNKFVDILIAAHLFHVNF